MCTTSGAVIGVLDIVQAVFIALPHLNAGIRNRIAVSIGNSSFNPRWLAFCALCDIATVFYQGSIVDEEGTNTVASVASS